MRGGLSIDSASVRLYAGHSDVTSCDLPVPHYHFAAGSVKWVTNTLMVARPAVLYVRDVPILWLPFIFQDIRPGRRSGILVPRFGINDVVRTNPGFRRHVSNVGYYIAINDYIDFQASLDWFAETSVTFDGETRYRWRDRFVRGGLAVARVFESGRDGPAGARCVFAGATSRASTNEPSWRPASTTPRARASSSGTLSIRSSRPPPLAATSTSRNNSTGADSISAAHAGKTSPTGR
jgi:hypothetical protein